MNETPSFEKKSEFSPRDEQQEKFALNEQIFDKLDALPELVVNKRDRKDVELDIAKTKRGAFEVFEEALDRLSGEDISQSSREKKTHGIVGHFSSVGLIIHRVGKERPSWISEDPEKLHPAMERAAFDYVSSIVLDYEKALQNQEDPRKILSDRHVSNVVDSAYIEDHILRKINNLPTVIRENLFKIQK